jgi:hypothetical protein
MGERNTRRLDVWGSKWDTLDGLALLGITLFVYIPYHNCMETGSDYYVYKWVFTAWGL